MLKCFATNISSFYMYGGHVIQYINTFSVALYFMLCFNDFAENTTKGKPGYGNVGRTNIKQFVEMSIK